MVAAGLKQAHISTQQKLFPLGTLTRDCFNSQNASQASAGSFVMLLLVTIKG